MKISPSDGIKTIITAFVLFAGIPVAFAWTSAPANPPKDNVDAPVNISANNQNKTGKLGLGGLAIFGKLQLIDGTQGAGKVLVSDADGKATWAALTNGATVSAPSVGSSGGQILPGWPNALLCTKSDGNHGIVELSGWDKTTVWYSDKQDRGFWTGFSITTRKRVNSAMADLAPYATECLNKNIDDPVYSPLN